MTSTSAFPEDVLPEDLLAEYVDLLVRVIEAAGALIIFLGACLAVVRFLKAAIDSRGRDRAFTSVRLGLGRYLALGLEFQLASDILSTAVAPTFEEIGKLAAIATIRTLLNYFLRKEIEAERSELDSAP